MSDSKDPAPSSSSVSRERSASSSASLIVQVANYCWSHNFLSEYPPLSLPPIIAFTALTCTSMLSLSAAVFTNFFRDHAEEFIDAPPLMEGGEHDLKYYSLFQKYLKIYEAREPHGIA